MTITRSQDRPPAAPSVRSRRTGLLAGFLLVGLAVTLAAPETGAAVLSPEYEVTVADGASVRALFQKNAWAGDFGASNLSRGVMARLGPVLYAVGSGPRDSWKGRLVDFLSDQLVAGRPLRVSYFRAPRLSSPFGLTVSSLGGRERAVAGKLLDSFRSGADVATEIDLPDGKTTSVAVTPLLVRSQRFAAVLGADALVIGRDPRVVASLAGRTSLEPSPPPAVVDVDIRTFFAAWSAPLEKLFGVGPRLRIAFDFDAAASKFTPKSARLPLREGHLFANGPLDDRILKAIPASVLFFTTASIPDPAPLSRAGMEDWFRSAPTRAAGPHVAVTFLHLGMRIGDKGAIEAMTALLVPQKAVDVAAMKNAAELFPGTRRTEVRASRACPGLLVLSPSRTALERIEAVCSGREPSFRQMPPALSSVFTAHPVAGGAYLDAGGFLKAALRHGWQAEWSGAAEKPVSVPKEIGDSLELLDRLPKYAFAGPVVGDALVMAGVER